MYITLKHWQNNNSKEKEKIGKSLWFYGAT